MWRNIPGFEGYYQASEDGRIRSVDRYVTAIVDGKPQKRHFHGRELKQALSREGYCSVLLHVDGTMTKALVHRLVALTYIPNPENKPEVNHINSDRTNNCVGNLEWVTSQENTLHAGKRPDFGKPVPVVRSDGERYPSVREAARKNGCIHTMISKCCRNQLLTVRGYEFMYDKEKEMKS